MLKQYNGEDVYKYRFECMVCGVVWWRWFYGDEEVREYLRMREVCVEGRHVYMGSMLSNVRWKEV